MSQSNVTAQLHFNGIETITIDPIVRMDADKVKIYSVGIRLFDGVKGHSIMSADWETSIENAEIFVEHFQGCIEMLKKLREKEKK